MVTCYRRLPEFNYLRPESLDEVLSLLEKYKGRAKVIAGGTDIIPKLKRREIKPPQYLIDIKNIHKLDYIKNGKNGLKMGALTTINTVESSPIIQQEYNLLYQAARSMASVQIRNRGTIAGNICNAVPSADNAPALLVLDAKIKLLSVKSSRIVEISKFFTGPNKTVIAPGELLQEIKIPQPAANSKSLYIKLTPRHSMDLAVVGVAVLIDYQGNIVRDIKIALGAVSPTPIRARKAEAYLLGKKLDEVSINSAAEIAAGEAQPISDHRASAEYRKDMIAVLTRRAINQLLAI